MPSSIHAIPMTKMTEKISIYPDYLSWHREVLSNGGSIEKTGIIFGLVPREQENEGDVWTLEHLPGNYMALFEPWNSSEHYT